MPRPVAQSLGTAQALSNFGVLVAGAIDAARLAANACAAAGGDAY
jgi:hypothetical protein